MNPIEKFWRWTLQPFLAPRELRELKRKHNDLEWSYRRVSAELQELRDKEMRAAFNRCLPILTQYDSSITAYAEDTHHVLRIRLLPLAYQHHTPKYAIPHMGEEAYRHTLQFVARELGHYLADKWFAAGVVEKMKDPPPYERAETLRIRHRD